MAWDPWNSARKKAKKAVNSAIDTAGDILDKVNGKSALAGSVGVSIKGTGDVIGGELKKLQPKMPKIPTPEVMPTSDEEARRAARRRALAAQRARSGRASTMLSGDRESLG